MKSPAKTDPKLGFNEAYQEVDISWGSCFRMAFALLAVLGGPALIWLAIS